jgi:hypothetical protein
MGPLREIQANFGEEEFQFDLTGFIKSRNEKWIQEMNQVSIPLATVQEMIREYLLFNGYGNTLKLYEKAIHRTPPPALSSSSSTELSPDDKMLTNGKQKLLEHIHFSEVRSSSSLS